MQATASAEQPLRPYAVPEPEPNPADRPSLPELGAPSTTSTTSGSATRTALPTTPPRWNVALALGIEEKCTYTRNPHHNNLIGREPPEIFVCDYRVRADRHHRGLYL